MDNEEVIYHNAVCCTICNAPADRLRFEYLCTKNKYHRADLNVVIFEDHTPPFKEEEATTNQNVS